MEENTQGIGRHRIWETEDPREKRRGTPSRTKRSPRRTESRLEQKGGGLQEGGLGLVGYLLQGVGQISNRCEKTEQNKHAINNSGKSETKGSVILVQYLV